MNERVIIFGRYPVPGRTKTRLSPLLGPVGAAEIQRRLTEQTLHSARALRRRRGTDLEMRYTGGSSEQMGRWLGTDVMMRGQGPGDLGARMERAFLEAFGQGSGPVVLVGTDIPRLTEKVLEQALAALRDHDLVLGPSTDGGYWLMGLKKPADLFGAIPWGTPLVLSHTLEQAARGGLSVFQLEPLRDVDKPEDLLLWDPGYRNPPPYVSVIIPALNESRSITGAIRSARARDAEILVVDGGSSDSTVKRATRGGVRVVKSAPGRARQQNRGAEAAAGKILLFLHADSLLPKDYVMHVFETCMDPGISLGAFRFRTDVDGRAMRLVERMASIRSARLGLPYGDQGLFVRKGLFRRVGGFPEVPLAEELFLIRRLKPYGRIATIKAPVTTSGRRWRQKGLFRTWVINQIILAAIYVGISPHRLAHLYGPPERSGPPRLTGDLCPGPSVRSRGG